MPLPSRGHEGAWSSRGPAARRRSALRDNGRRIFSILLALDGTTCNAMTFSLAENLEGNPSQSRPFEERRFSCGPRPGRAAMFLHQWKPLTSKASVKGSEGAWEME